MILSFYVVIARLRVSWIYCWSFHEYTFTDTRERIYISELKQPTERKNQTTLFYDHFPKTERYKRRDIITGTFSSNIYAACLFILFTISNLKPSPSFYADEIVNSL